MKLLIQLYKAFLESHIEHLFLFSVSECSVEVCCKNGKASLTEVMKIVHLFPQTYYQGIKNL